MPDQTVENTTMLKTKHPVLLSLTIPLFWKTKLAEHTWYPHSLKTKQSKAKKIL